MSRYASQTSVAPEKSRGEIERTLVRYGASAFGYAWLDEGENRAATAAITFIAEGKQVRLLLPLPRKDDYKWTPTRQRRTQTAQDAAYEQAVRQRWRALALCIKAKLEAVAAGIVTFEEEFLAHFVLPDGGTVGEWFSPQLAQAYETGQMPGGLALLLPAGSDNIIDIEDARG